MALEEGAKVSGTVSGITNFGAFIDLADNKTGLVHISQVSDKFIKDIHDVLTVGDKVMVKVMKIEGNGKIALSMKQATPTEPAKRDHHDQQPSERLSHGHDDRQNRHHEPRGFSRSARSFSGRGNFGHHKPSGDFNDMLSSYLKESESRLSNLKRQTDGKRGGRGGRRS